MSPATVAIIINPPPTLSHNHKLKNIIHKTPFISPSFYALKESAIVYPKPVRLSKTTKARSFEHGVVSGDDNELINPAVPAFEQKALIEAFHQTPGGPHAIFNRVSKGLVGVILSGLIILRHDDVALWGATGSVLNYMVGIGLKQILKQERPVSEVNSSYGMPSSHAQNIFYAFMFVIQSVVEWHGLNGVTAVLSVLLVALASYFSWLRVLFLNHTTNQVVVGAIMGSIFSVIWFWLWETIFHKAYNSNLWVRIFVLVGAAFWFFQLVSNNYRAPMCWIKSNVEMFLR